MANGLKIRGLTGDVDRVSVQSSDQSSHLLTRRRWSFMPASWTEYSLGRDELVVLKCNEGEAWVDLKHLGGPHGDLMVDMGDDRRARVREGCTLRVHLARSRAVFLRTQEMRYPRGPGERFVVG